MNPDEKSEHIKKYQDKHNRKNPKKFKKKYYYLIKLRFLGFRYSGWQKQTNAKTIQEMFEKTISFVLGHNEFKTLGSGRTDAMVSANEFYCELFINEEIEYDYFFKSLKENLPADIDILNLEQVDEKFEIISGPKEKEYLYFFSNSKDKFPFSSAFMANIESPLDLELMKKGARLFEGNHNFKSYCFKPNEDGHFLRTIKESVIDVNDIYSANFFPEVSYVYKVRASGFMRHQVRIMMGTLFKLGLGEISLDEIEKSLKIGDAHIIGYIAPSSGLMLNKTNY